MQQKLDQLKNILAEAMDIYHAARLLIWDLEAYMPSGGAEGRSFQTGTLMRLYHEKVTSDETGKLLEELAPYAASLDAESNDARLIQYTAWQYRKRTKVPSSFVAELNRLAALSYEVWAQARPANDFARFQPYLERIVDASRQYVSFFAPYEHVYDPLLDDYERGMKTAEVQGIFEILRPQQVALVQTIAGRPQVENAFLHQPFDPQKQLEFGKEVITRIGYDWNHGRLDEVPHPFTGIIGIGDVRITTRVEPNYLSTALFSTIHEAGHALYELGIDPTLDRTPLASGTSMAIHESQSRLWENLVGRSRPFWQYFYPRLQEFFPDQLGNVDLEAFYKGINRVEPSLIRTHADEVTYNLHIMLRMELEIALMEGSLEVKDLPDAWNSRMQEYLGVTPPNDADGALQDAHWSDASFGYFPTYTLGNLVSAQLWESIHKDLPDVEEQIRWGEFAPLLGWLRDNIHRHGSKYTPQELVQRVTGSRIDPAPYLRYLQSKYGELYGLS